MSRLLRLLSTCLKWGIPVALALNGLTYAQVQIPQLPPATVPLTGTEQFLLQQSGVTKQTTVGNVVTSFLSISAGNGITVSPNPITGIGSISLTTPVTVPNGGTGTTSVTGLVLGNGAGPFSGYAGATCTNQFLRSLSASGVGTCNSVNLASDVTGNLPVTNLNSGTGASATTYWSGAGTWTAPAGGITGLANPSGLIGLTAVNGVATTAVRSDATHALDQSIAPTWTGDHTFTPASGVGVTVNAVASQHGLVVNGANNVSANSFAAQVNSGTGTAGHQSGLAVTGGTNSSDVAFIVTNAANTSTFLNIAGNGNTSFGNSTDQPSYQFNGVPSLNVNTVTSGFTFGGTLGQAFPVLTRYAASSGGSDFIFYHSRGTSVGTNTILQANDEIGSVSFDGSDGTSTPVRGARILGLVDGTPSAGTSYPGRLEFYTTPSGSTSLTQRMILNNQGTLTINSANSGKSLVVNETTNASGDYGELIQGGTTASQSFGLNIQAGTASNDQALRVTNAANTLAFANFWGDGHITFPNVSTTASAANAFLDNANSNSLLRSTSSRRYKKDIKPMTESEASAIWKLQPISYHSKAKADDPKLKWYGLVAEDVAAVDPRLVVYDAQGRPDGVQYDRIPVLMLKEMQDLRKEVTDLRQEVDRLKHRRH